MKLLVIIIMSLVVSCSSKKDVKNESNEDELSGITNDAFIMPDARGFSIEDDFLEENLTDDANVLAQESIAKVDIKELVDAKDVNKPLVKGLVACYQEKYDLADRIFDEQLRVYRNNPIYWTQIANCFLKKGNKRKALLYYNKAKETKKRYAPPVNNIGVILERKGFPQKSLKAYEEAMRIASFSLTPMYNSAILFTRYGLVEEAEEQLKAIRRLSQDDYDATNALAYVEMIKGNFKNAVIYYSKIDSKYYSKPEVGANLALALMMSGKKNKAKKIISNLKATENPALTEYILQIGKLL